MSSQVLFFKLSQFELKNQKIFIYFTWKVSILNLTIYYLKFKNIKKKVLYFLIQTHYINLCHANKESQLLLVARNIYSGLQVKGGNDTVFYSSLGQSHELIVVRNIFIAVQSHPMTVKEKSKFSMSYNAIYFSKLY